MLASRTHWRLLTATIVLLMAALFLAPGWLHAPDIQENRVLAVKPPLPRTPADIHAFRKGVDSYVSDHFPARPFLIAGLNRLRMLVGVSGSSRVIVGRDGWLFYDDDSHMGPARGDPPLTSPQLRTWMETVAGRTEYAHARGAAYLIVTPPAKETIYPQYAPRWAHVPAPERPAILLPRLARVADIGEVLYLYPAVAEATRRGEKTYSRHDTHWTGYGAYAGYVALMRRLQALGLTEGPLPLSAFRITALEGRGEPRDLALMLGVASFVDLDYPGIDNPAGEARMKVTYLDAKTDWTGLQMVDTGEVGKPVLLMTRDSFSNELLPLLLPHFSRIILSHNQDGFWRGDLIDRYKPDIVISEVIEAGLRVGVGDGPTPSAAAVARIDAVLGAQAKVQPPVVPAMPSLPPATSAMRAVMAQAQVTPNCNLEVATLQPGQGGEAIVTLSGWISELGPRVTAEEGLIALRGAGLELASPIKVNGQRPDVAAYFKVASGEHSGFLGTYFIRQLPPGAYAATVYRRAPGGWIGCTGKQRLIAR